MAGPRHLTDFEQVLLLMVAGAPSSGYGLKQAFAITPLGVYKPSSGALYPALRRLERRGLLQAGPGEPGGQGRRRFVYHITAEGMAAHEAWVRQPVDPATISQDLPLHVMRFVAMERLLSRAEVLAFLADLRDALAGFLDGLESYTSTAEFGGRHSALALDHGVSTFAASLAWAKRTINALARPPADRAGTPLDLSPRPGAPPSRPAPTSRPAGP